MINTDDKNEFIFPFSTCESPNENGIAQPYSVLVNSLSLFIILYFLYFTKKTFNFLVLFTLFIFEAVHTFSHFIHLDNSIQVNIIHPTAYIINIFFILALYEYTKIAPSIFFLVFLFILFCIDLYMFLFFPFLYSFTSSFLIFFSIIAFYYNHLNKTKQQYFNKISILGLFILVLFYNEYLNCKNMMLIYPDFPFHIILESVGVITFYVVCDFFYKL